MKFIIFFVFLLVSFPNIIYAKMYDNHGLGILSLRSQSIAQSLRLTLPMMIPNDIKKGYTFHGDVTWTNVWAENTDYLLDYEMFEYIGGISYGFEYNYGVKLEIIHREYVGGGMDKLIQNSHDLFGFDQNGRDNYDRNRHVVNFFDRRTSLWRSADAEELNNTGINLLLNYDIFGSRFIPCINFFCVGRYTIESVNLIKTIDHYDFGVGIGISKRLTERFFFYTVLGYTFYNDDEINTDDQALEFEKEQRTALVAVAWQYHSDFSIVCQFLYGDPMIKNVEGLNEASRELHLGIKIRIFKKHEFNFSLIENAIAMDNSPDFGFHAGFKLNF